MTLPQIDMGDLKPNSTFQNLFHVEAGGGSKLTAGLRKYNLHFTAQHLKLMTQNKRSAATALKIIKFVLDLFICPVLGTLALIGVGINALHVTLNNHSFRSTIHTAVRNNSLELRTAETLYAAGDQEKQIFFGNNLLAKVYEVIKQLTRNGLFISRVNIKQIQVEITNLEVMNRDGLKKMIKLVESQNT